MRRFLSRFELSKREGRTSVTWVLHSNDVSEVITAKEGLLWSRQIDGKMVKDVTIASDSNAVIFSLLTHSCNSPSPALKQLFHGSNNRACFFFFFRVASSHQSLRAIGDDLFLAICPRSSWILQEYWNCYLAHVCIDLSHTQKSSKAIPASILSHIR